MATATGTEIMARARVIASQQGIDANSSAVIDSAGGNRALLNNTIRSLYRAKSDNQKFVQDIVTLHTVVISSGTGAVPEEIMREFMHTANITDEDNSLVSYMNYAIDATNETFDQLGYLWIVGDTFHYTAPTPDFDTVSTDLFVTVPSFPEFPAAMTSTITFPSTAIVDDLCIALANALRGEALAVV